MQLVILISTVYLMLETSFFISLMNAIRHDKVHTVDDIEFYGRALSGFGLALLMFKSLVFSPIKHSRLKIFSFVIGVYFLTFYGQKLIVDTYIDSRSESTQNRQYRAYMIQKSYTNNVSSIPGTKDESTSQSSADVQIAFLAPIALSLASTLNDTARLKKDFWLPIYQNEFKSNTSYYYNKYLLVNQDINSNMQRYNDFSDSLRLPIRIQGHDDFRVIKRQYRHNLRRFGHEGITKRIADKIYKESGIRMSESWHPDKGRREFIDKYMASFSDDINKKKQKVIKSTYGIDIALQHIDNPLENPSIIKKVNEQVGIFSHDKPFKLHLTQHGFYQRYKDTVPNNLVNKYSSKSKEPQQLNNIGRIFFVPFIALFASALCILLNTHSLLVNVLLVTYFNYIKSVKYHYTVYILWIIMLFIPYIVSHVGFGGNGFLLDQMKSNNYLSSVIEHMVSYTSSLAYLINSVVGNIVFLMF